jgi:hypothetical protein
MTAPFLGHDHPCKYDILSLRNVGQTGDAPPSTAPQARITTSSPGARTR